MFEFLVRPLSGLRRHLDHPPLNDVDIFKVSKEILPGRLTNNADAQLNIQ